ncbi:MAG: GNAT family N-acetyltransferase [Anaerolineae bacterium]|nr:GNAT family N-acetyltransferase [Anaerolineae bacterium]
MQPVSLIPAATFDDAQLAALVNQAYADYYLPIWMEAGQFAQMCNEEDVVRALSVVAVRAGNPVGLALLSRREARGWISAVGVLPEHRRLGIARRMLQYVLQRARDEQLTEVLLEVLEQNQPGKALYNSLGFQPSQELLVLALNTGPAPRSHLPEPVRRDIPGNLLRLYTALHDLPGTWQRALPTLRHRLSRMRGLAFWHEGKIAGYVLYVEQRHNQVIQDLAVLPGHPQRLHWAQTLLKAVHGLRPHAGGYIVNLPAVHPLLPAFTGIGYKIVHRQQEMIWVVPPPS